MSQLQYVYSFWFSRRATTAGKTYGDSLKLIATIETVEQFWSLYSHLAHPNELSGHCDYHVFKSGIKPLWEDEANKDGGKWIVRMRKGLASRCWENLLLALLGEQFMVGDDICGCVCSCRFTEDIVSIWNRSSNDTNTTMRIRDTLKRILNLPPQTVMEYKSHGDSLRDNSSFRNTHYLK